MIIILIIINTQIEELILIKLINRYQLLVFETNIIFKKDFHCTQYVTGNTSHKQVHLT